MKISDISIRRPVLATVLNLVILLMGFVAYERLQLREYPNIDVPTVSIETNWRGASAEIMESQVTKIIEDSVSGIEGIDYIKSTTRAEQSQINVIFRLGRDADNAAADVRDRVGRVRGMLPDEVDEPIIAKTEANATPIMYLALSSDTVPEMQVTDIADRVVQDRLQTLPGVASAEIYGAREYSMRIWIDPQKLTAYNLTPEDVSNALLAQNLEVPAGRIEGADREFTVLAETDLKTAEQFTKIIIKRSDDYLVRLGDVARVELAPADTRVVARHNNKPAVAIGVVKQSTANPLDVSHEVTRAIEQINPMLPEGISLSMAYDSTVFIDASLKSVYHTIFEAIAFVAVVIFLFLRSLRASIIPLITIPISLLGALVLMLALGFSLNTLTLLAFVLAIGLVVDDAIVMLENIQRYVEEGMEPYKAALVGSKEIGFAVIAMTLTLAAVYAPIGMAEGRTGKLFTEFALALAGAVVVSGFIALTLTPMLSSRLLKVPAHLHSGERDWLGRLIDGVFGVLYAPGFKSRALSLGLITMISGFILALAGLKFASLLQPGLLLAGAAFALIIFGWLVVRSRIFAPVNRPEGSLEPSYVLRYRELLAATLASPRKVLRRAALSFLVSVILLVGAVPLTNTLTFGLFADRLVKAQQLVSGLVLMTSGQLMGPPPADVMAFINNSPKFVVGPMFLLAKPLNIILSGLPQELSPQEDRGFFIGVGFGPEGSTIDYTQRYAQMIEGIYNTIPERNMHFVVLGFPVVNQMLSFVNMKDWSLRERSTAQIAASVGGPMFAVPGLMAFPVNPPSLGQDFLNTPVNFIIQTTGSWDDLNKVVGQVMGKAMMNPGIMNLRPDLQLDKPELRLAMNRDKVADVGASIGEVGRTLETLIGGRQVTRFKKDGEQYDVIVQVDDALRRQPSDLTGISVRGMHGEMIQLSNLLSVQETVTPKELNHFAKLRSATLTATLAPGYSLGDALSFLNNAVKEVGNPSVSVEYGGNSREFIESNSSILFVFALAIIFIYLVLAAQFESFIDPLVILLSVPLAMFGALMALALTGNSINIYSQIGLVTLVGLIAKNGILIVEFANQLQEQGREKLEAVLEASALRLRPILMTSAAMVLGAVPLALSSGAGAEARGTIGWVIVGGISIGTLFTLFVIPVIYVKIGQKKVAHSHDEAVA